MLSKATIVRHVCNCINTVHQNTALKDNMNHETDSKTFTTLVQLLHVKQNLMFEQHETQCDHCY